MLSFHVKFVQTDRWTGRLTDNSKTICPLYKKKVVTLTDFENMIILHQ